MAKRKPSKTKPLTFGNIKAGRRFDMADLFHLNACFSENCIKLRPVYKKSRGEDGRETLEQVNAMHIPTGSLFFLNKSCRIIPH